MKTLLVLFTFVASSSFFLPADTSSGIDFIEDNLNGVFERASNEGKLIFIDCYTSWCGPCKYMDREVFSHPVIGDYMNTNFINVKVDMESRLGQILANEAGVDAFPTYLFVNGEGDIVHSQAGAMSAQDFYQMVARL